MTFQISKFMASPLCHRLMVLAIVCFTVVGAQAQQLSMKEQLAALQRLEAMQPDSLGPKIKQAVLLLGFVCTNPQDSNAKQYVDEAQRIIRKIEALKPQKAADRSDLATLQGFYYTALIVMNPQQNGPRYYRQALDNLDKALKINPGNMMAKMLSERFKEGMTKGSSN